MLEYASIRLRSVWPRAAKAPTRMETVPTIISRALIDLLGPSTEVASRIRA
jgi:hypothetical protein